MGFQPWPCYGYNLSYQIYIGFRDFFDADALIQNPLRLGGYRSISTALPRWWINNPGLRSGDCSPPRTVWLEPRGNNGGL